MLDYLPARGVDVVTSVIRPLHSNFDSFRSDEFETDRKMSANEMLEQPSGILIQGACALLGCADYEAAINLSSGLTSYLGNTNRVQQNLVLRIETIINSPFQ